MGQPAGIAQPMRVGGLAYGTVWPLQWAQAERLVDFFDVKNDIEQLCAGSGSLSVEPLVHPALHPGRSAAVLLNGQAVGMLGELHPLWVQKYALPHAPVVFELDVVALQSQTLPTVRPLARAPAVSRDLSFVVGRAIPAARILQVVREARTSDARCGIVQDMEIFDVFLAQHDEGKTLKSVALRLTLQAAETLTDMQADAASEGVIEAMQLTLSAKLRS